MENTKDIDWLKTTIVPALKDFEIIHKFFKEGGFGSLNQVQFNSQKKGGVIDFWSSGWLSIYLVDYMDEKELLNVFLEPSQNVEKEKAFEELQRLLKIE